MINFLGLSAPGGAEWLVILIMGFFVFVLPIFLIVLIVRYIKNGNAERRRLRIEISKLADELEQTRKNQSGRREKND